MDRHGDQKHPADPSEDILPAPQQRLPHSASRFIVKSVRPYLLDLIEWETQKIAALQKRYRHVILDELFAHVGALGTHTAFLLFLPMLFWFSSHNVYRIVIQIADPTSEATFREVAIQTDLSRVYGRHLVLILGAGVYISGAVKDYFCLPRPYSPPVYRRSVSVSVAHEYGFPSTHTTNALSLSLFSSLFFAKFVADGYSPEAQITIHSVLAFYVVLIGFSRIFTGMHTLTDVIAGAFLGAAIVLVHWYFIMPALEIAFAAGWLVPVVSLTVGWVAISFHPEPDGPCPCYDDSVAFVGVVVGILVSNWHYTQLLFNASEYGSSFVRPLMPSPSNVQSGLRLLFGIVVIFLWRLVAKRVCYTVLPRLFVWLSLPFNRRFFTRAKDYKTIPSSHIFLTPSIMDLKKLAEDAPSVPAASNPGAANQPVRRLRSSDPSKAREALLDNKTDLKTPVDEPTGVPRSYKLPRYDVDISTKLVVYFGIAWWATEGLPLLFPLLRL
ncbi:PAP2 superfamily-domain-containing protein [Cladochytrium replicatum]|nr:PAP2 superfamily-domain-containing protein [Cladochytrium replicatum]